MFFLMVTQWGIELFCFHEQTQFYQVGIATWKPLRTFAWCKQRQRLLNEIVLWI
jgi:hypothetical protein